VPGEAREGRRGAAEEVVRPEFRGLLDYEARAGRTEAVAQGQYRQGRRRVASRTCSRSPQLAALLHDEIISFNLAFA
jgi:hypothetical protein